MDVKLFHGTACYAQITDVERGFYKDIRLEPGRGAPQALREYAVSAKEKAAALIKEADIALEAASILENKKK